MEATVDSAAVPAPGSRAAHARVGYPAAAAALITAAAFALRVSQLHQSILGDEVLAFHEIFGHSLTGTVRDVAHGLESSPPLFFALAWISAKLGDPTVWLRLPSLLLSTATIPLVYLLGRETVGRRAGLMAAAILAVSPFAVFYGVEGRPYATLAFLVVLSTFAVVRAVETGRRRWWAAYAVTAAAAAYTHYTVIFVLLVQGAWALWMGRHELRAPVIAIVAASALFLPWLPELHGSVLGTYALLEPLTAHNLADDLLRLVPGYPLAAPLHQIPTVAGYLVLAVCVAGGLGCAALRLWRRRKTLRSEEAAWRVGLVIAIALATPVGVLLYSLVRTDIWGARNIWSSIPAIALLIGALLAAIPRPVGVGAFALVVGVLLFGTIRSFGERYARPPYRPAAEYLDRVARPPDPIVVLPSYLNLNYALPAMLSRRHLVVKGQPTRWPVPSRGGTEFVVFDLGLARVLKLHVPRPPGLTLVARRVYGGPLPFALLTYRASGA